MYMSHFEYPYLTYMYHFEANAPFLLPVLRFWEPLNRNTVGSPHKPHPLVWVGWVAFQRLYTVYLQILNYILHFSLVSIVTGGL